MKYIVELSKGNTYEFKDPSTATNFAAIALTHRQEKTEAIEIRIEAEEEE